VLYVTERCVFALTAAGLELIEVAPGVDIEKDIVAQMGFAPVINKAPRLMDERIFRPAPMGLRGAIVRLSFNERFSYDAAQNIIFINFEGHEISSLEDVEAIRAEVESRLRDVHVKPHAVVNYDNFSIRPEVIDAYSDMVTSLVSRFYDGATRYTTSSFLRLKLGNALQQRNVSTYIYESSDEAKAHEDDMSRPR
jgi:propionate CoA-transferase